MVLLYRHQFQEMQHLIMIKIRAIMLISQILVQILALQVLRKTLYAFKTGHEVIPLLPFQAHQRKIGDKMYAHPQHLLPDYETNLEAVSYPRLYQPQGQGFSHDQQMNNNQ